MRLIACHIENFGKLSDLTVEFADGINVINQSNAWGKSTLAAFLKAMFYGLDTKKDPKAFEKERNLYRPWQGGAFGGELDFEVDGKAYRISRSFGRTEKNDEFHLYDLSTNLESTDYSAEIGLELFDLDSASFRRSIFIAQNDCLSETSDRINAKLGNLAESANDINNFEMAISRMKELLNQLTPERVTGSIKKRKNYITQLTQELKVFETAQDGLEGILHKKKLVEEQIEELMRIRKDYAAALVIASEDSRRQELYVQYEALCAEVKEKEEKREAFSSVFPTQVPSAEEFEAQTRNLRAMEETKATLRTQELTEIERENHAKLSHMFEEEVPTDERIDAAIAMLSEIDKQKEEITKQELRLSSFDTTAQENEEDTKENQAAGYKVFMYLGIGIMIAGIVSFAISYFKWIPAVDDTLLTVIALFAIGCGWIFYGIGALLGYRYKKAKQELERSMQKRYQEKMAKRAEIADVISAMKEDLRKVYDTINEFLGTYHVYCEVKEYQSRLYELKNQVNEYERLEKKQEAYRLEQAVLEELRTKVSAFAGEYQVDLGDDIAAGLRVLQTKATEYKLAVEAYEEMLAKKEQFEQRQDKSFWTKEMRCPYSIAELNQMIQEADETLEERKASLVQYGKQLEELQEQLDMRDEKQQELDEQLQQQDEDMRKYNLVKVTSEFLQKAKEQFTAKYMEPIARGFSKYYQMLSGNDACDWMLDANLNLKVREYGELRDSKWLSAGYQDLIGICMRLALVDAMYQGEKPFLLLDDPFVNLDGEKVGFGNQLLLEVAKEYQIVYFTCHDSRSPF